MSDTPPDDETPVCAWPGCSEDAQRWGRGYRRWCVAHLADGTAKDNAAKAAQPAEPAKSTAADKAKTAADKREAGAREGLEAWLGIAVLFLTMAGDEYCATALTGHGREIVRGVAKVSKDFPGLATSLAKAGKYSGFLAIFAGLAGMGGALAVHHGGVQWRPVMALIGVPNPEAPSEERTRARAVLLDPAAAQHAMAAVDKGA